MRQSSESSQLNFSLQFVYNFKDGRDCLPHLLASVHDTSGRMYVQRNSWICTSRVRRHRGHAMLLVREYIRRSYLLAGTRQEIKLQQTMGERPDQKSDEGRFSLPYLLQQRRLGIHWSGLTWRPRLHHHVRIEDIVFRCASYNRHEARIRIQNASEKGSNVRRPMRQCVPVYNHVMHSGVYSLGYANIMTHIK